MQTSCEKCGGMLPDGQSFCTVCGTRRSETSATKISPRCAACGAELEAGLRFCTHCGAVVTPEPQTSPDPKSSSQWASAPAFAAATPSAYVPPPPVFPSAPSQANAAIQKESSPLFKLALAAVVIIVLGGVAVAGGVVYVGYIAKKRIAAAKQAYQQDDYAGILAAAKGEPASAGANSPASSGKAEDNKDGKKDLLGGLLTAATGGSSKPVPLPEWKPAPSGLVSSPPVRIPLRPSLQMIYVATDRILGDSESVYKIDSVNRQSVHVKASQQFPKGQGFARFLGNSGVKDPNEANKIDCSRTLLTKDLATATEMDGIFCRQGRNELKAGRTDLFLSKKTFEELKRQGQSIFTMREDPMNAVFKSFKAVMTTPDNDKAAQDAAAANLLNKIMSFAPGGAGPDPADTPPIPCVLHRDGPDVLFPVIVNNQPAELPALKVTCTPQGSDHTGQLLLLDDPEVPLVLSVGSTAGGHSQITRINWDFSRQNESALAEQLEKDGRAKVYDLYFDFRSDVLRPESGKIMNEIAQVTKQHPDWKLGVEGNTDNIGGDKYNLDLSQRRAAAVKTALTRQYGIAPDRLETNGFGASHPIDTNDTIEGRARNRRVELVRK
ncbi:OmpA family protein [Occallatibacter savannae]|uniref:OmpA family protein n=1 Tax=Occallatibacter savannae TaxID=1002691 RepID=UPI000D69441A|nr:OmpA family protein [Occallatibacter savannae]